MEQKKTLWIIAAVGVFLLIVLGAAGIFYSPSRGTMPSIASVSPVEKKGNGWKTPDAPQVSTQNQPVAIPGDNSIKVNDMVVLADNATVYEVAKADSNSTTIDLNSLKHELALEADKGIPEPIAPQPQNINITVNVPETTTPVIVEPQVTTPVVVAKADNKPSRKSDAKPADVKTSVTVKKSSANSTKKVDAAPAPKTEPKKTQFWVQVAAYSNKKGAENARSALDDNKIPADIFTYKDNKDKLYYRVRVGPYTTKSEAEYWRTRIEKIDTFAKAESYVTSTTN